MIVHKSTLVHPENNPGLCDSDVNYIILHGFNHVTATLI